MGQSVEKRRMILDAARDLLRDVGYERTTMRAIGDRIGYTAAALYHHFRNKEALLAALVVQDYRVLLAAFVQLAEIDDPVVRLVRAAERYVDFGLRHPQHYRLAFMDSDQAPIDTAQLEVGQEDPVLSTYEFLRVCCQEAIAAGRFRAELRDPDEAAQMLWSALHGLVALRISRGRDGSIDWRDPRRTALRTCATLVRGLTRTGSLDPVGPANV